MNQDLLNQFLLGAIVMACGVAGLYFLRFYRKTHERLFAIFALPWRKVLAWASLRK